MSPLKPVQAVRTDLDIHLTGLSDLPNTQRLWAEPAVMIFVGFPEGLHESLENLETSWLPWVQQPPKRQHWSVYEEGRYCGETFYAVDETGLAAMDIKLLPEARGRGIASAALSFALDAAFHEGGAKRAYVDPDLRNEKALALYNRLGFQSAPWPQQVEATKGHVYLEISASRRARRLAFAYDGIVLRDYRTGDIDDDIRWNTVETQWALWDGPWEMEAELASFDAEAYRAKRLKALEILPEDPRWSLELDADGRHIGSVSAYLMDADYNWIARQDVKPGQPVFRALGIDVNESAFWGKGLGTKALTAWILYHLDHGMDELYLQTWSGNERMIHVAEKLGFSLCRRKPGLRQVRGGIYDGLTFRLDVGRFQRVQ